MLPSHSSAGELLNVAPDQTKHIDNDCDTNDDDDDDDSDDSSRIRRSTPAHVRLNVNGAHRLVAIEPTDMTVTPKIDNLIVRRPSALQLKPINTTNLLCSEECALNLSFDDDKVETSEVDGRTRNDTQKRITIGFENVKYSSRGRHFWERGTKTILNGLSGEFRAGELTAIMGPSGAGKSTLMDILTGYTTNLESGHITINGRPRDLKLFRRQSAYIMQDHVLQSHITVWEAMHFSANLKIGNHLTHSEKRVRIQQILEAIGLYEVRRTRTGELSGGQRKRLAIALELVDNPPVMFFDEPNSGLDSSTATQVILLLKQLAQGGRTIVCTIHQPSALVFGLFDHLYALAEGRCIYAGGTQLLVPFLAELDLVCPKTYNPSDYLLEISTHDYGNHNDRLVSLIDNGKSSNYRKYKESTAQIYSMERAERMMESGIVTPVRAPALSPRIQSPLAAVSESPPIDVVSPKKPKIVPFQLDTQKFCRNEGTYATSFWRQWSLLMVRAFMCLYRDKSLTLMRVVIHGCIGFLIGVLYFNIGNDAAMIFNNFRYIFMSIMFLMFTSFSTTSISFPLELPIVTREHFNRWYSIKAYYFAMTFADLPIQILCVTIFVAITYTMTAQPLELFRIALFYVIICLVTLVSQGWGMITGAVCGTKLGQLVGPFVIAPFMVFSGFFLRFADAHPSLHWLFHISYLKHGLEGAALALFGYDRPKMECERIYCQYRWPNKFMKLIDMHNGDMTTVSIVLIGICLALRIVAFFIMSYRIKRR